MVHSIGNTMTTIKHLSWLKVIIHIFHANSNNIPHCIAEVSSEYLNSLNITIQMLLLNETWDT